MWIELHDSARDHPKILKLARVLGTSQVVTLGHVTSLWLWTLRMAPDGDLSSFDEEDIEIGAMWDGPPGKFVEAAVAKKLLDVVDGAYRVHDWEDYSGSLKSADRKRKERERKAAYRAKKAAEAAEKAAAEETRKAPPEKQKHESVPGTSHGRPGNSACVTQNDRPTDQTDLYGAERTTDGTAERSAAPPHPPAAADEVRHTASVSPAALEDTSPEVLRIPLLAGEEFVVTETLVAEWGRAYPAVAIEQELRALREWALSNPTKRKRNGRAFCTRNLARKQEEGGTRRNNNSNSSGGIRRNDPTRDENGEPIPPYLLPIKFDADGNPYRVDLAVQR